MKFLKSTIAIVALLAIVSVNAKQMGKTTTPAKRTEAPTTTKSLPAPTKAMENAYSHLANQITSMHNSLIETNDKNVGNMISNIRKAHLTESQKTELLALGADKQEAMANNSMKNQQKFIDEQEQPIEMEEMFSSTGKYKPLPAPRGK